MWSDYPLRHIRRYPWLVLCIWCNYRLRSLGLLPDRWYAKDIQLLEKVGAQ